MDDFLREKIPTYNGMEEILLFRVRNPGTSDTNAMLTGMLSREFGGPWKYNEIIGYLRLYLFGNQIRIEYWQVQVKRIVKSRKKLFGCTSAKVIDEVAVKDLNKNNEIKLAIEAAIKSCEIKFKKRHLDLHHFNLIKDYVDWVNFIANV
ncbi:hypothetical protein [Nitrosomonas sp.]|uniref:hypothetical protein n=1 Tax=Nitrosomonas sp. TaxID=42353 RepID=UPI0025E2C6FE|nr:hypothetical protein [Nitrosomonas sp.]